LTWTEITDATFLPRQLEAFSGKWIKVYFWTRRHAIDRIIKSAEILKGGKRSLIGGKWNLVDFDELKVGGTSMLFGGNAHYLVEFEFGGKWSLIGGTRNPADFSGIESRWNLGTNRRKLGGNYLAEFEFGGIWIRRNLNLADPEIVRVMEVELCGIWNFVL
jgi:hypothetical protein